MSIQSTFSKNYAKPIAILSPASFTFEKNIKKKIIKENLVINNLEHANHMLDEANKIISMQEKRIFQLEKMLQTDELTNLLNRRAFVSALRKEISTIRRQEDGSSLLVLIDINKFSEINSQYGRSVGDAYLQTVSSVLMNEVRNIDSIARLENDRFAVLFTQIEIEDIAKRLDHLEKTFHNRVMHHHEHTIPLSASFGYAIIKETSTIDEILLTADVKLYKSKAQKKKD